MTLNKADTARFKKRLETMKQGLIDALKVSTEEVKKPDEATGYSQHQADQGTDDFDRHINLEVAGKEFALLKQIDRALDKIEEGTYGICDISNEPIPKARLEAIPYAATTIKAQEKLERGLL